MQGMAVLGESPTNGSRGQVSAIEAEAAAVVAVYGFDLNWQAGLRWATMPPPHGLLATEDW